jgi:large subunit ribosomal protein L15
VVIINVGQLDKAFEEGAEISVEALVSRGLVPSRHDAVKVLGDGELTKKFIVKAHRFSKSAEQKIVAASGKFERV